MQRLGDPGVERVVHERTEGERGDPVLLLGILHRRDTEHVADEVGVGTHGPLLQAGGRHDLAGPGRIGEDDTTEVAVGGEVAVEAGVVGRQAGGEELGAGPDFGPGGGHDRFGERATRLGVVEERPDVVLLHGRGEVGASESGDEGRDLDEPLAGTAARRSAEGRTPSRASVVSSSQRDGARSALRRKSPRGKVKVTRLAAAMVASRARSSSWTSSLRWGRSGPRPPGSGRGVADRRVVGPETNPLPCRRRLPRRVRAPALRRPFRRGRRCRRCLGGRDRRRVGVLGHGGRGLSLGGERCRRGRLAGRCRHRGAGRRPAPPVASRPGVTRRPDRCVRVSGTSSPGPTTRLPAGRAAAPGRGW